MVRISTGCDFCGESEAQKWFTPGPDDKPQVCIPRETCIEMCGPEGYGCVYSGSSLTRLCFSGVDSKRPAVFTTLSDDGRESELFVDNGGEPVDADPPAFGPLGRQGNETSLPSGEESPSPVITPEASVSSTPPVSPDSRSSKSFWVWLGPVIGLGMLGSLVAAGLVLIVVRKRRTQNFEDVAPPVHMLPLWPAPVHTQAGHTTAYSLPTPTTPVLMTPPVSPTQR